MRGRQYIYSPKGAAQEYVESSPGAADGFALNPYSGCEHGCEYCYVPGIPPYKFAGSEFHPECSKTAKEVFHAGVMAREGIVKNVLADARNFTEEMKGKIVLISFTGDPYPESPDCDVTRLILEILEHYRFRNVTVLTKGGTRACRDFDLLARNFWSFGTTAVTTNDDWLSRPDCDNCPIRPEEQRMCVECIGPRTGLEPNAASFGDRMAAIQAAHERGILTWVSLEPVLVPKDALAVIEALREYVDLWKIGKINHGKQLGPKFEAWEKNTDWPKFAKDAGKALEGRNVLWKKSMQPYLEK